MKGRTARHAASAAAARTLATGARSDPAREAGPAAEPHAATSGRSAAAAEAGAGPRSRAAAKRGFVERLVALFSDLGDPEWEKRRQLRLIERQLRSMRQKFYNPRKSQVLPGLAVFFHTMYRVLTPARSLIGRAESSNLLRTLLIESAFSESQMKLYAALQDEAIAERSRRQVGDLAAEVRQDLQSFVAGFDAEKVRAVNLAYGRLMALLDLVHFDFYFFLHKFDAALVEGSFGGNEHFHAVDAGYVAEDLRDLWERIVAIDTAADWGRLLEVLRTYRDVEIVSRDGWKRVVGALNQLKRSRLLELIIKHAEGDPSYRPRPAVHNERIVDAYLQKLRTQVEAAVQRVVSDSRARQIDALARAVFGTPPSQRLLNYAERSNAELRRTMGGGYTLCVPLNYLIAYLQDGFDAEARPVVDVLLISGKWATKEASQAVSEALHSVLEYRDRLVKLDQELDEQGDTGARIAAALRKADRRGNVPAASRKILQDVNDQARDILVGVVKSLVGLGKGLQTLIADRDRPHGEVVLNWRELDAEMGTPVRGAMLAVYRKLAQFVQLTRLLTKP
jgi:nucleotide-binding universal stress UspA family protein